MNFNECYQTAEKYFLAQDMSSVGRNFSALVSLTGEDSGYIYMLCMNGRKLIEPIRHPYADIRLTLSTKTFEDLLTGKLDPIRAFTTGQVQAHGNVMLALAIYHSLKQTN